MQNQPFISVVVSTYNRCEQLKKLLERLAQQTYPEDQYEVIVVDDGSEDNTGNCLRQLAGEGKLRYFHQRHLGAASGRNAGAKAARGEVLVFTDDDCLPEPEWLAVLAHSYRVDPLQPPDAVGGQIKNQANGHWLYPFYAAQATRHQENVAEHPTYLDTANASFRRPVFLELKGFNARLLAFVDGHDTELGIRFLSAGYRFQSNPQAIVWHVGRPSLWGMIRQSYGRGRGLAVLMIEYPEVFVGSPSWGLRLRLKNMLDELLRRATYVPQPVRPFACAASAALRRAALTLPEIENFIRTYLRKQLSRYQAMDLNKSHMVLYFLLEWCDYLPRLAGRVVGTFTHVYRQECDV